MALGWDGTEYLVLPYLFMPHGTEPCPKWLADHPGWFRILATLLRRATRPMKSDLVPVPQDTAKPLQLASADSAEIDMVTAPSIPPTAPLLRCYVSPESNQADWSSSSEASTMTAQE